MEIQNIVATTDFGCRLDLHHIKQNIPETKYNPNKFNGLTLRIKGATAQLFGTGKCVCLGTKTKFDLDLAGHEFARILNCLGYNASFNKFAIKNLVASVDVGFKIRVEILTVGIYNPELFPALQYKLENVTFLVFHSGKVIATGAKQEEEIKNAYNKLYPALVHVKNE